MRVEGGKGVIVIILRVVILILELFSPWEFCSNELFCYYCHSVRYFKQIAKSVRANGSSSSGSEENADDFLGCINISLNVRRSSHVLEIKRIFFKCLFHPVFYFYFIFSTTLTGDSRRRLWRLVQIRASLQRLQSAGRMSPDIAAFHKPGVWSDHLQGVTSFPGTCSRFCFFVARETRRCRTKKQTCPSTRNSWVRLWSMSTLTSRWRFPPLFVSNIRVVYVGLENRKLPFFYTRSNFFIFFNFLFFLFFYKSCCHWAEMTVMNKLSTRHGMTLDTDGVIKVNKM